MEIFAAVILSMLAGGALGFIFFWGLWKTVQSMSRVKRPFLWMFASFLVRLSIVLMGFYVIMQIQWQLMAVALMGFIFARFGVIRYTMRETESIDSRR